MQTKSNTFRILQNNHSFVFPLENGALCQIRTDEDRSRWLTKPLQSTTMRTRLKTKCYLTFYSILDELYVLLWVKNFSLLLPVTVLHCVLSN